MLLFCFALLLKVVWARVYLEASRLWGTRPHKCKSDAKKCVVVSRRGWPGWPPQPGVETQHRRGSVLAHPPATPPGTPPRIGRATGRSQTLPGCFSCESCMDHRRRPLGTDPGSAFVYFARGREMCRTLPFWDGGPGIPAEVVSVVRSLSSDRVPATEHHDCQRNPWHRRNGPHHWAVRTGSIPETTLTGHEPPLMEMLRSGWNRIGPNPRAPQLW